MPKKQTTTERLAEIARAIEEQARELLDIARLLKATKITDEGNGSDPPPPPDPPGGG